MALSQGKGIPTGVIPFPPPRPWNIVSILISLAKLLRVMHKYQVDIVHADDLRQVLYLGILKPFLRFKLVWHIRVSWKNHFFDRVGFYLSRKVICTAKIIAERFKRFSGSQQKVGIIYNAVDHSYFMPLKPGLEIKEKYNIGPQDFVIGVVSRLEPIKGIHFLIDAVPPIQKVFKNIKIIIVGDGPGEYKQGLEEKADKLGVSEFIRFVGFKEDVRPFLNISDLFILPTLEKEGTSRAILEAMACGLAVLTTDTGGNRELVEDGITGVIIPNPEPAIIASETIRLLFQKERLIQMGSEGRKRVEKKFSILENVRLTEEIYLGLKLSRRAR